jgi:hypothetical protein
MAHSSVKVLIGISTAEIARQAIFYDHIDLLGKPDNTLITRCHGQSPAAARNLIIKQALKNECTHVLFLDDDVVLRPDTLYRLLNHQVSIISGLYLMRNNPHLPICFATADENGWCTHKRLKNSELGMQEVVAAGLGCLLIETKVFEAMKFPWITMGELDPENWCDDLSFCMRARKAGFRIHVDLNIPVGHMATVTIWPNRIRDEWHVTYDTAGTNVASFPMVVDE